MSLFKATPINDDYHHGILGEFKVVIRTSDGWINISKLCASAGIEHKKFKEWKKKEGHKEMLKFYSKIYEPIYDPDEQGSDWTLVQKEYYCLDMVGDSDLKGIPKAQSNIIRGSYVPNLLAVQVAQWVSFDFGHKVSTIVVNYYSDTLKLKNKDLTEKNNDLMEELRQMREETKQMFQDAETKNQKRHGELKSIIKSAIDLLKEEPQKGNQEILLIYRLINESKETLHIHAGKRSSFKIPSAESCSYLFIGDFISNGKRILRFLKDKKIVPHNGSSSTYSIVGSKIRRKIYDTASSINVEYKKLSTTE
jgi:hypothetical protein